MSQKRKFGPNFIKTRQKRRVSKNNKNFLQVSKIDTDLSREYSHRRQEIESISQSENQYQNVREYKKLRTNSLNCNNGI